MKTSGGGTVTPALSLSASMPASLYYHPDAVEPPVSQPRACHSLGGREDGGMNQASPQATLISTIITFAIIGVVLFFRLHSMSRERPLKLGQLWIVPGIFLFIAGFLFWSAPPK